MAKFKSNERDAKHELSRRSLIKWSLATGAALGVSRSRIYEVLEKTAGRGVAFAAENPCARSVHLVAGNGGLAWFQLLWPHVEIAGANNPGFAWHKNGTPNMAPAGTDKPLWIGPDTPFASLPADRQPTLFVCGQNQTHTSEPDSALNFGSSNLLAAATAMQSTLPAVVPAIRISNDNGAGVFGTHPGASAVATIQSPDGLVDLFNSAASQAGGLLSDLAGDNATLYKQKYQTFVQLNAASGNSTNTATYLTGQNAASFLGTNLAAQLAVTPADLARYGINAGTRAAVATIGRMFIIAVKAFKLGLTNCIALDVFRDDPHGAFGGGDNGTNITSTVPALKAVFDGFMADLQANSDESGTAMSETTMFTIHGDTTKQPRDRDGWPDGTQDGSNVCYMYGARYLKTGWFGRYPAAGNVMGFDPATGNEVGYNNQATARGAAAAALFAIARADKRRADEALQAANVAAFEYSGLINQSLT